MDLAELAKRENLINEARKWYAQVNILEPKAPQGWLEHAKLEEESGELDKCDLLLRTGLEVPHCRYNESLIIKYIKLQEQRGNLTAARSVLARLKHLPVDKAWKIVLEGALLESRAGNVDMARKIFKYLIKNVPRHGPIYYEAYRLEEKCENYERALQIVQDGLEMNPRYGPLWFSAFHLLEKLSKDGDMTKVRKAINDAVECISKELVWKVYFESAQIEERANNLEAARAAYVKSVDAALENLRWKVWLAGARTELNAKNIEAARLLLNRALTEVPTKSKAVVLIECARLEEYVGNIEKARAFLKRAQKEAKHEWKVFLESILLETRAGDHERAIEEAENALEIHRGTGRLWAVLIQLKHIEGEEEQLRVFKEALEEVPKSGEVWCEGARIRLNPLSPKFNLEKARRYLEFAIKFTPQYGDSLIEYLRLELLQTGPRVEQEENKYIEQLCVNADPNYGPLWVHCKEHPLDSTRQVLRRARDLLVRELLQFRQIYQKAILQPFSGDTGKVFDDQENLVERKDFITGLHSLNKLLLSPMNLAKLTEEERETRKKFIFGSELSI
jgi:la-related protein 1